MTDEFGIPKFEKTFLHVDIEAQYGNAVVPSFNSSGKPDLLGWDEAMENSETQIDTLVRIYHEDLVEVCKKAIDKYFSNVDLNDAYMCDDVALVASTYYDTEDDGPTLKWFWQEVVQEAYCYEENLSRVDFYGNDYEWDDQEKLHKQIPTISDFIHFIQEEASDHVRYYEKGNMSDYFPINYRLDNLRKLMELAEELYGDHYAISQSFIRDHLSGGENG